MMQHLIHGDRERVVVSENSLRQRITHQDHFDPSLIHKARGGVVVRSKTADRFVSEFQFPQRSGSHLADLVAIRKAGTPANRSDTHYPSSAPPARPDRACSASSWMLKMILPSTALPDQSLCSESCLILSVLISWDYVPSKVDAAQRS